VATDRTHEPPETAAVEPVEPVEPDDVEPLEDEEDELGAVPPPNRLCVAWL
jgi:hypothetical protein